MANFSRAKVFKLSKGFKGKRRNTFRNAIRTVHRSLKYQYRDRRQKKRIVRQEWIMNVSTAVREHGITYSRFMMALNRSNISIDRKILCDLAINEPYSFKTIVDEVKR